MINIGVLELVSNQSESDHILSTLMERHTVETVRICALRRRVMMHTNQPNSM